MYTEFFCGIGGLACCLPFFRDAISIDINQNALAVHELNHSSHRRLCKTIESLSSDELLDAPTELWWLSPPCQPFTRRGNRRDLNDPRSAAFLNMLRLIEQIRPNHIGLENVPEFENSESHLRFQETLSKCRYHWIEATLCPTQFGSRNRRRRFYIAASQTGKIQEKPLPSDPSAAICRLETSVDHGTYSVPKEWLTKYQTAIHIVPESAFVSGEATTNCFTSAYGRSPVHCGTYLNTGFGIRRFTPLEILWQLGFPESFRLPDWPPEKLWPLTGNTLALPAIRFLLSHLPMPKLIPCP